MASSLKTDCAYEYLDSIDKKALTEEERRLCVLAGKRFLNKIGIARAKNEISIETVSYHPRTM